LIDIESGECGMLRRPDKEGGLLRHGAAAA